MNSEHPSNFPQGESASQPKKDDSREDDVNDTRIESADHDTDRQVSEITDQDPSLSSLVAEGPNMAAASSDSANLESIGRYRIVRLLGVGGFGSVYLAEDEVLHRQVALKVPRLGKNSTLQEREFLTEARQLAQLSHPGIVSVFDIGYDKDRCFIVSDFLSGPSLGEWLAVNRPDWQMSAQICLQIADALAHAHANRTIHRDLKPSNIIIVEDTRPVIVDFGLAVSDSQRADGTMRGEVSGTPSFMSPEQATGQGHRIDGRTDIYSLGSILYRMLTGREPFRAESANELLRQVVEDEPQPPRQVARNIPAELERICLKAMEKSLRRRYTTADDMANDLRTLVQVDGNAPGGVSIRLATDAVVPDRMEPTVIGSLPADTAHMSSDMIDDERFSTDESSLAVRANHKGKSGDSSDTSSPRGTSIRHRDSQRRQVTIINCSCDVFENDAILEALDSEEQAALLNAFQEYCSAIAEEFQGTILQMTEDGIAVCFGFPVAFEDAVRRAVRFALAVRDRMVRFHEETSTPDLRLASRVSLHTDHAIAESDVDEHDRTTSVSIVGAIRNVASKLTDFAEADCVVMSHLTWMLCHDRFECESLGYQKVRGLTEPIELHAVISEHSRDFGFDGAGEQNLTPLVGRDREIGLLQERWEQAVEGMGQVVLIIGHAGLGKSRLVHSIKRHVLEQSADSTLLPVAEWRASSQRQNSSWYPAVDFFEQHLGFEYADTPESRLKKLVEHLNELDLGSDQEIALLAGMLSIPLDGQYPELELSPQFRKELLLKLLLDWLRELSYRQPLLFVIEDLHWVDPSTLEFLELLVDQGLNDRILTLFTFRPEFETPWGSKAHQTNLALNRLTRKQLQELMELRAKRAFPDDVVNQIMERTDGVPLFVEEFTKLLIDSKQVTNGDSSFSTIKTLQQIPASLHDMLMSRLDRIDGDIEIMQLGAAIGRVFSLNLVKAATGMSQHELERELQKLVDAELLFTQGRGPRTRYSFKHALIQDAAYNSLVKRKRQKLHRSIAEAIEASFPDICTKEPEVLARHFAEAGDNEKAFQYWDSAGERSLQRYAYREAIEHIRGALAALDAMPKTSDNKFREIELHISLGVPLQSLEGYSAPSVEENYARAYQLCKEVQLPMQFIPVLYGLFRFYMLKARHDKARELGRQLVDLATQAGEDDYFLFAHRALAGPMVYQAEYEAAIPHLNKALSIPATETLRIRGRRYDVVDPWVNAGSYKSWALWFLGFPKQAHEESQRAIAAAESLNHPFSLALALSFSAWLHQFSGDVENTLIAAERAQAISREQGFLFWVGWHKVMISWSRGVGQKDENAIDDIRQGIVDWRAQGSELGSAYFHQLLADVALVHRKFDVAEDALDEADRLSGITGEAFSVPEHYRLRGRLALRRNEPIIAEAHLRKAIEVASEQSARLFELRSTTRLSRLLRSSGRAGEALEILTAARSWFTEGFETRDLNQADKLLNELNAG